MTDVLGELERLISGMSSEEIQALDAQISGELAQPWLPTPGPQCDAYYSEADLLLFGGAAGGGKTDLVIGLALTAHRRAVIFRRAYVDLRGVEERLIEIVGRQGYNGADMVFRRDGRLIEFGALEKPGAEQTWQGRPHDLIAFDEGAQLSAAKVSFVLGWLRSSDEAQRCRAVIASNPPIGGEGEWLIEWFAPWLDPMHPSPATPGELRWAYIKGDETVWVDGPGETVLDGETYTHQSRTFVPSHLSDNPYLRDTGYRARLQNMPEPLRSQLLKGDFLAGRDDHEYQVIPSEWVRLANERWRKAPEKRRPMLALSADVALGGGDDTAIARLHADAWFAPLLTSKDTKDPKQIADMMLKERRDGADLSADGTGGWGSGVRSNLVNNHDLECALIVFSAGSNAKTRDGKLGFRNLRAELWWKFRESLDPDFGDDVKLPPDPRLTAELTTPRYKVKGTDILVEEKAEIKKRVGGSTDRADAVIMAWHRRAAALKTEPRLTQPRPRPAPRSVRGAGWMRG